MYGSVGIMAFMQDQINLLADRHINTVFFSQAMNFSRGLYAFQYLADLFCNLLQAFSFCHSQTGAAIA